MYDYCCDYAILQHSFRNDNRCYDWWVRNHFNNRKDQKMKLKINTTIKKVFGCSSDELSSACWEVITKSNDYFGESEGYVTSIQEIDWKDRNWWNTYGVVSYEKNYAIGYRMYNRDGTRCCTTVHWTSLRGGLLCHGTNAYVSFKTKIKTCPAIILDITFGSLHKRSYARVLFGGTEPTFEEKVNLIHLLAKKRKLGNWSAELYPTEVRHILYGQRTNFVSCTRFLKALLKGKYDIKTEVVKTVTSLKYLGTSVDSGVGVYKVIYEDGSTEYKKMEISNINETVKYGKPLEKHWGDCPF